MVSEIPWTGNSRRARLRTVSRGAPCYAFRAVTDVSPRSTLFVMPDRLEHARSWLSRELQASVLAIEPASGDASFRRYFRVTTQDGTFVLMDAPPENEDCRPFVKVARLLGDAGLTVPDIHAADLDAGFLLLGDLGSTSYLDALEEANADRLYTQAIDALVRMQTRVPHDALPPYDEALLRREMRLFPEWFLKRHLGMAPDVTATEVLDRSFEFLCECAAEQPRVFVHRDYHSRNLMLLNEGNPGILDFQDAVSGPIAYDLVSLLRDVYIEWPAERTANWMATYCRSAKEHGLRELVEVETLSRWVDLTGAQRHIKIAGIFSRLLYRDGKANYLGDIPLTLRYLLTTCSRYPELKDLHDLLKRLDVESKVLERNSQALAQTTDR